MSAVDTIEISNGDALRLYQAIGAVGDVKAPIRFTYACGRTRRALQPIVEAIDAAQRAQHAKYLELAAEHAQKDGDTGEPVKVEGEGRSGFQIDPARQADFAAAAKALNEELSALLAEVVQVQIHRVPVEAVPELAVAQVDALLPMIADG